MSVSQNLKLPYVAAAQAQKHVTVNEAFETIDVVLHLSVETIGATEPPETPAEGTRTIVADGAVGAFSGQDGNVAIYRGTDWTFIAPTVGWLAFAEDDQRLYAMTPEGWRPADTGGSVTSVTATLSGATLAVAVDGQHGEADLSALRTTDASALATGTLSADRLPSAITGRSILAAPEWTLANGTFGGTGFRATVADDGTTYLAGATGPDAIDATRRLSWSGATGLWQFEADATAGGFGIGGAHPDPTNRLAVQSPAVLMSHAGDDLRLTLNKADTADTASVVFQSGWSGRAEFGVAGTDDFSVKVSPDGTVWHTALSIDRSTGRISAPAGIDIAGGTILTSADATGFATAAQGALAETAVQSAELSGVAVTGLADDLTGSLPDTCFPVTLPSVSGIALTDVAIAVASRAALQSSAIPGGVSRIAVRGFATENDGGAVTFARAASEPSHPGKVQSQDGAWWELLPEANGVFPEMFGGGVVVADNSTAIQAAIDFAVANDRAVLLRGGDYTCTSPIELKPNLTMIGAGTGNSAGSNSGPSTRILFDFNGAAGVTSSTLADLTFVTLRDITFASTGTAEIDAVLDLYNARGCRFESVRVGHNNTTVAGDAVRLLSTADGGPNWVNWGLNCQFGSALGRPFDTDISDSYFVACYFSNGLGSRVRDSGAIAFVGCHFDNTNGQPNGAGLTIDAFKEDQKRFGCRLSACYFDKNTTGLAIDGSAYTGGTALGTTQVSACYFRANGTNIRWNDGSGTSVTACTFDTPSVEHFSVTEWTGASIIGNTYQDGFVGDVISAFRIRDRAFFGEGAGPHGVEWSDTDGTTGYRLDYKTAARILDFERADGAVTLRLDQDARVRPGGDVVPLQDGLLDLGSDSLRWSVGWFNQALASRFRSGSVTIADDAADSFFPPTVDGILIVIFTNDAAGVFVFNTSVNSMTAIASVGNIDTSSAVLSGTTGVDGRATVSARVNGRIYFENRLGAAVPFRYLVIQ